MSELDKDKVIAEFTKNFKKAEGKEPQVDAKGGWYSVDGGKNMRLAQLQEWSDELASAKATKKAETSDNKKSAEKKASKKKADSAKKETKTPSSKKTKTAKKPSAKKAKSSKKSKGGFSVKDFWIEKNQSENPGSRAPR